MKKLLFIACILLLAPLSRNDVDIRRNRDEIERIKQHLRTKKITVDGVIQSLQPLAGAYLNVNQDNLTNATWTKILLDAESFDIGNDFNVTDSSFTVPITGYYQINASIHFEGTDLVADKRYILKVLTNTASILYFAAHSSVANKTLTCSTASIVYLTLDDEVTLWAYPDSGGNLIDIVPGSDRTFLSIRLVQ